MKRLGLIIFLSSILFGCKDSQIAQFKSIGSAHRIICYSGGQVIYDGYSTGNVSDQESSDGFYWEDAATRKLVETNADCVITQR